MLLFYEMNKFFVILWYDTDSFRILEVMAIRKDVALICLVSTDCVLKNLTCLKMELKEQLRNLFVKVHHVKMLMRFNL